MRNNYRLGIDVGTNSIGVAALRVDDCGLPVEVLRSLVLIHDAGVGPGGKKAAVTRLAASGLARRVRRMLRKRKKRLVELDRLLVELGFPLIDPESQSDSYFQWRARARLASERVEDAVERRALISVAVRHVARHRGWRNPYSPVESLLVPRPCSEKAEALRTRMSAKVGRSLSSTLTIAQILVAGALHPSVKLRGAEGLLGGTLEQIDYANELRAIAEVQGLSDEIRDQLIRAVFKADSPKGSASARVGKDELPGQGKHKRASKSSLAFQRFRIVSIIANLRIAQGSTHDSRRLTSEERVAVLDYLAGVKPNDEPTWADVAEVLGIERERLRGTASVTADGDRAGAKPPVLRSDQIIRSSKISLLVEWWVGAPASAREGLLAALSNGDLPDGDTQEAAQVDEILHALSDDDLAKLDSVHLPSGRAAYSEDSLLRLTRRMLEHGEDLHEARMAEFGVPADWVPPAEPLGTPVGNPAVDRTLKALARIVSAVESEWGIPNDVVIEHVRSAFGSEAQARKIDFENNQRAKRNEAIAEMVRRETGASGHVSQSDIIRLKAVTRQNGQCLYCGGAITFATCELDHIVPRAGVGSNNSRSNLVAACRRCNHSKGKTPFAEWASRGAVEGVALDDAVSRVRHFPRDPGESVASHRAFAQEMVMRLKRKNRDPEIDGRTMESVAYMANEVRHRVEQGYRRRGENVKVSVYRGQLTAEARKASGLEGRIPFIGGRGKTRFDRRHHAIDAATVAMMNPSVARTLAERTSLRQSELFTRGPETWKEYRGSSPEAVRKYGLWLDGMGRLADLLAAQMNEDRIPVMTNLRLRLGDGSAHDDTIRELDRRRLSEALPVALVDRASTPALWCALTRAEGFDPEGGLAADEARHIVVHGKRKGPNDEIGFFKTGSAALAVRGGYAEIGDTIHHVRVYSFPRGKKTVYGMLRVFSVDLLKHRHGDLFEAPIPPHSITRRTAEKKLRLALEQGTATYLGWLVVGDELKLDMDGCSVSGAIGDLLEAFPGTTRWRVSGFPAFDKLRLRPALLASEGIPSDASRGVTEICQGKGWRPAVNVVFGQFHPVVVRRDALGRPRLQSASGLPVCWRVE